MQRMQRARLGYQVGGVPTTASAGEVNSGMTSAEDNVSIKTNAAPQSNITNFQRAILLLTEIWTVRSSRYSSVMA